MQNLSALTTNLFLSSNDMVFLVLRTILTLITIFDSTFDVLH